ASRDAPGCARMNSGTRPGKSPKRTAGGSECGPSCRAEPAYCFIADFMGDGTSVYVEGGSKTPASNGAVVRLPISVVTVRSTNCEGISSSDAAPAVGDPLRTD